MEFLKSTIHSLYRQAKLFLSKRLVFEGETKTSTPKEKGLKVLAGLEGEKFDEKEDEYDSRKKVTEAFERIYKLFEGNKETQKKIESLKKEYERDREDILETKEIEKKDFKRDFVNEYITFCEKIIKTKKDELKNLDVEDVYTTKIEAKDVLDFGDFKIKMKNLREIMSVDYKETPKLKNKEVVELFKKVLPEQKEYYKMWAIDVKNGGMSLCRSNENEEKAGNYIKKKMGEIFKTIMASESARKEIGIKPGTKFEDLNPSQCYLFINKVAKEVLTYWTNPKKGGGSVTPYEKYTIKKFFETREDKGGNAVCKHYAGFVTELFKFYKDKITNKKNQFKNIYVVALGGEIR
ncbi:MAG TPA: hypothetical protein ENI70_01905, partial [Candidatus Peregrinibacteria bacterium]|nr:hypothetical protein [Candidatus Peregrinibacteria bacterium]